MKLLKTFTLVAVLLLLLTGCSSMEDDVFGTWTTSGDGVTLVMHLNKGGGVLMEISDPAEGYAIEGRGSGNLPRPTTETM